MEYLSQIEKKTWLRYVLVSDYSDDETDLNKWAEYVSQFKNVERVDILPFHQMAIDKWTQLGYNYMLKNTPPTSIEQVQKAESIFKSFHLPLY